MVALITAVAASALAAAPGSFAFEGIRGEAQAPSTRGFFATGPDVSVDAFEPLTGDASARVHDRTPARAATYGDEGDFRAEFRVGLETWRITLDTVGAPPVVAAGEDAAGGRTLPFSTPLEGGVRINEVALGNTGIGPRAAPARAAFVLFGRAQIERNGVTIADAAPVQIIALATGVHADDPTGRRLRGARAQDTELIVYAPQIDSGLVDQGFFYAVFEDVEIRVAERTLPQVSQLPVTGGPIAPGLPVVTELENLPELTAPQLPGFRGPATDAVPLAATPLPDTPPPLNASDAVPLPEGVDAVDDATPLDGPEISVANPAAPLPESIQPLNAEGALPAGDTTVPSVPPANASAATPLIPTVQPLNAQPLTTGANPATPALPGVSTPALPGAPGAPAVGTGGAGTGGTAP